LLLALRSFDTTEYTGIIVLEGSHTIYSVYTHCVIREFLNAVSGDGNAFTDWVCSEDYDPDEIFTFVATGEDDPWMDRYEWFKDFDVIGSGSLDMRFVDIYPTYHMKEIEVTENTARILQFIQDFTHQIVEVDDLTEIDIGYYGN